MESSSQDKNLPATPQRLKKARDDGQVARSKDLTHLAVLGGRPHVSRNVPVAPP